MNVLLACSAGMSTSLLVAKMKEAAAELGVEAEIWAVAQDKALVEIEKADVLLVGPQMRFMKKKYEAKGKEIGVPVEIIDAVAYGRVDGMAVMKRALELAEK
ncbi:PTS system oligo-beta-mannoside-specific EIIB component [Shouchella clausii]|uniref:PTS sugar transporter subunit IIB n=1 Tax=Shouchella tritolerans TaxID=2979466 RepID=UPI0007868C9F|nr:PTS sugar transporter subunit IIB [Shouchella tritolerans]GIN13502.1 PTS system oligo-beta-mannoside-specific EIIB component [Shouchella clausii]